MDEYDNDRGSGGDSYVVRAVPFNTWDAMEPFAVARTNFLLPLGFIFYILLTINLAII